MTDSHIAYVALQITVAWFIGQMIGTVLVKLIQHIWMNRK